MKLSGKIIIVVIIALILSAVFIGCEVPALDTANFNMIFKYGVTLKNELNTFEGTYTRDMILDPPVTVELVLTEEERDIILQKMVEIDLLSYPERFSVEVPPGEPVAQVTPHQIYYFKVDYGSQVKELWWEDKIVYDNEQADRLRELIELIIGIIESREEYKNLPSPRGGYA